MTLETLRALCLALPGTTEHVQWGDNLVFKVGGKMYCLANTDPAATLAVSFKCDEEQFAELCERDGVVPAPYLARAHWVALETWDTLGRAEFPTRIRRAYEIVRAGLSRRVQAALPPLR